MSWPNRNDKRPSERGSLLLVTLGLLMVLSLMALSAGYSVRQKLQVYSRLDARERLRLAAEAGAQYAAEFIIHNLSDKTTGYQSLNQPWANSEVSWKEQKLSEQVFFSLIAAEDKKTDQIVFGMIDEGRKLSLMKATPKALQTLFERIGLDAEDARRIVAAIRDWQDADDDLSDGGAESKDYRAGSQPYEAKNDAMDDLSELLWVKGISREIYERIRPYLTITSQEVNLNTAPRIVLLAMGLDSLIVDKILLYRAGKDQIEGTLDDGVFKSIEEAPDVIGRFLYLNEADQNEIRRSLSRGFSTKSEYFTARIIAGFQSNKYRLRAETVINKKGEVLTWSEEFF